MEEKLQRAYGNGHVNSTIWTFDGIRMGHSLAVFKELTSFTAHAEDDNVRFHFGIKGNYSFTHQQLNQTFDLIGGHHNIMCTNGFDMTVYNRTLELETFGIQFPKELFVQFTQQANEPLQRFAHDIMNGRNALLSEQWGAIDPAIQQVIHQVIHCKYSGELKRLFLLSKSIELLVLCADAYQTAQAKKDNFIRSNTDKEKIIAVRDIINDRLQSPPNLSQIAKMVGLNEYKLKRGFKEVFNTTVFGYLSDQRLHLAKQYLQDTQKTAAEISMELGYATPQHFNNAFKKRFGFTPHSVRNNP
jgi:AraC family transcriptional regulator, transcriptional activator of the genes for pyochelin and ferripyochelin receptors